MDYKNDNRVYLLTMIIQAFGISKLVFSFSSTLFGVATLTRPYFSRHHKSVQGDENRGLRRWDSEGWHSSLATAWQGPDHLLIKLSTAANSGLAFLCDVAITGALFYYIHPARNQTVKL